jgi:2-aminoadipate transaminase
MTALVRPVFREAQESPIRAMLGLAAEPGMISLAGGHPDPDLLPHEWVGAAVREVLSGLDGRALQYGATEGLMALRESVCAMLRSRRIEARVEDVMITTGSQQGVSLLATVLLEPGDSVAMAPYNYPAAVQAVRFAGGHVVTLNDDLEGIGEIAGTTGGGRLKALYVVPSFANPTGHVMSLEARMQLLREAARFGICVIEDDPYGELWFGQPPPDSLCALNQASRIGASVVYLTSFSKIVAPALRLGALIAPAPLLRAAKLAKQAADVHSGLLEQRILDGLLRSGHFSSHLERIRAAYRRKAQAMMQALSEGPQGMISCCDPQGGMFVWLELSAQMQSAMTIDWFDFGRSYRVLALPGSAFSADGRPGRHVRLSFANPGIHDVRAGVRRFAAGLAAEMTGRAPAQAFSGAGS